jgi:hypothetical protein
MTAVPVASASSALDIRAIQAALRSHGVDGWLLYDFHGSNAIAVDVI